MPTLFPPMATVSATLVTPSSALEFSQILMTVSYVFLAVLFWDWLNRLPKEISLVWQMRSVRMTTGGGISAGLDGRRWWIPGARSMKSTFLASRYLALLQAIFVMAVLSIGQRDYDTCEVARLLPFGFAVVSFAGHLVMTLRIFGLYGHSTPVLFVLGFLALVDIALQLFADTLIIPTRVPISSAPSPCVCYLEPSSKWFDLAFISPSIFHHIILAFTLWKCWEHLRRTKLISGNVIKVLRREHCAYVLAICLINFANVILVVQNSSPSYRLINFLPSMCLTQIFLGRIFFSLRSLSHSRPSPPTRSITLPISSTIFPNEISPHLAPPPSGKKHYRNPSWTPPITIDLSLIESHSPKEHPFAQSTFALLKKPQSHHHSASAISGYSHHTHSHPRHARNLSVASVESFELVSTYASGRNSALRQSLEVEESESIVFVGTPRAQTPPPSSFSQISNFPPPPPIYYSPTTPVPPLPTRYSLPPSFAPLSRVASPKEFNVATQIRGDVRTSQVGRKKVPSMLDLDLEGIEMEGKRKLPVLERESEEVERQPYALGVENNGENDDEAETGSQDRAKKWKRRGRVEDWE